MHPTNHNGLFMHAPRPPKNSQAALESRTFRSERRAALLRAQVRTLQGLPAAFPTDSPQQL